MIGLVFLLSFVKDGSILWEGEELTVSDDDNPSKSRLRLVIDKLGLDSVQDGFHLVRKKIDLHLEHASGSAMSATGFVTFYDLASVALASCARLSVVPETPCGSFNAL